MFHIIGNRKIIIVIATSALSISLQKRSLSDRSAKACKILFIFVSDNLFFAGAPYKFVEASINSVLFSDLFFFKTIIQVTMEVPKKQIRRQLNDGVDIVIVDQVFPYFFVPLHHDIKLPEILQWLPYPWQKAMRAYA